MRWAEVVGFPEYLVSDRGEVYSSKSNKVLKLADRKGYLSVFLYGEASKRLNVHRLVASAFIPNPFKLPQVNHIDEELELFWEKRKGGMHWKDAMRVFGISKGSVFNYDALLNKEIKL